MSDFSSLKARLAPLLGQLSVVAGQVKISGSLQIGTRPAFVAGDKYLVVDANGNVHVSSLGPAS